MPPSGPSLCLSPYLKVGFFIWNQSAVFPLALKWIMHLFSAPVDHWQVKLDLKCALLFFVSSPSLIFCSSAPSACVRFKSVYSKSTFNINVKVNIYEILDSVGFFENVVVRKIERKKEEMIFFYFCHWLLFLPPWGIHLFPIASSPSLLMSLSVTSPSLLLPLFLSVYLVPWG